MPSIQSYSLLLLLRYIKQKNKNKTFSLAQRRRHLDRIGQRMPVLDGVRCEGVKLGELRGEWLYPSETKNDRMFIYLHGGAYQMGSIKSHRAMVSRMVQTCHSPALLLEYRLAPEHPFPAAIEDVCLVYQQLLQTYQDASLIIVGDSAGGGLALASTLFLKAQEMPLPKALVLISPWVDLTGEQTSLDTLANKDPILNKRDIIRFAKDYFQEESPQNPLVSPLYGDLSQLPPTLIQVGTHEVLLGEAKILHQKMEEVNSPVELEVWKNMFHVWHFAGEKLPEAQKAFKKIHTFLEKYN